MNKVQGNPGIDPRIKKYFGLSPPPNARDASSREELLNAAQSADSVKAREAFKSFLKLSDTEEIASSEGLLFSDHELESQPDGNLINIRFVRPNSDETLPCIYYIHGGGMRSLSCYDGNYLAWARILAMQNVAVVMVDFRNALVPSSVTEVKPYPAGLNDCVSGLRWLHQNAGVLRIDPHNLIVSGDSGGGNLTLALGMKLLREEAIDLVSGLYALCPYIAGQWPQDRFPSSIKYNGIVANHHDNTGAMAYGMEAFERGDPLAWPTFAQPGDVTGLPPTFISVNEFDPLRDEGIAFYRLLLSVGVNAQARIVLGTIHATELFPIACPNISIETAGSIAEFCRGDTR